MREKQFVFEALFFDMQRRSIDKKGQVNEGKEGRDKVEDPHSRRVLQIGHDVDLVNKNISKLSHKVCSLYQKDYLDNYRGFIGFKGIEEASLRNKLPPQGQALTKKEHSPDKAKLHSLPIVNSTKHIVNSNSNQPQWKRQNNKAKLNNKLLNKMSVQICSLTESIPNLIEKNNENKYHLYEMNDFYLQHKRKPFKV